MITLGANKRRQDRSWGSRRTHDINLRGAFLTAKAATPLMRRPGGAMAFVSSGLAINVEPGFAAYTASKAGLLGLMKVLAKELAPDIRVNAVAPGLVETAFLAGGTGQGYAGRDSDEADRGARRHRRPAPFSAGRRSALPHRADAARERRPLPAMTERWTRHDAGV
jgi:3-oxoacyl-[acyl-carrier protein] reductase